MSGWESIHRIARSSPCLLIRYENGAMLTEHSPPTVVMRAGSCSWMISSWDQSGGMRGAAARGR
jgi:hypothetical protein